MSPEQALFIAYSIGLLLAGYRVGVFVATWRATCAVRRATKLYQTKGEKLLAIRERNRALGKDN